MTNPSDTVKHMLTVFERPLLRGRIAVQDPYHRHEIEIKPDSTECRVFQTVTVDDRDVGTLTMAIRPGSDHYRLTFHPCKELGYGSIEVGKVAPDADQIPAGKPPGIVIRALLHLWPEPVETEEEPEHAAMARELRPGTNRMGETAEDVQD